MVYIFEYFTETKYNWNIILFLLSQNYNLVRREMLNTMSRFDQEWHGFLSITQKYDALTEPITGIPSNDGAIIGSLCLVL